MPGTTLLPLLLGDLVALIGGLFLALAVRHGELPSEALLGAHLEVFIGIYVLWFVVFVIAGLYDRSLVFARKRVPGLMLKAQAVNMLLAALFLFVFPAEVAPKTVLALYLVLSTALLSAWRLFLFPLLLTRRSVKALVVGNSIEARQIAAALNDAPSFRFIEATLVDPDVYPDRSALESALLVHMDAAHVSVVIGDTHGPSASVLVPLYYNLSFLYGERDTEFISVRDMYEHIFHRVPPSLIGEAWLLENVSRAPHRVYDTVKRTFDFALALALGIASLVAYPFIMMAIKLEDGGPIFYRTERVGRYNAPIRMLKFRTMTGRDEGAAALATTLRVTRVGRFLRRTRLDELPQLWNVLRGDLSFIGPRPEMPALAAVYAEQIPYYNMRHLIKPGLSGWAQINHLDAPRQGVDIERTIAKLSYDLSYLKERSFFFDVEIMLKTIRILLMRSGT